MITADEARFLFNRVSEVTAQTQHPPKEKILKLRPILDSLFKELTEEEPLFFSNLYSRCVFVFDKHPTPPELAEEIHGFRVLTNKAVHERSFTPEEKDYLAGVKAVCLAIAHFSKEPTPKELAQIYEGREGLTLQRKPLKGRSIPFMKATVLGVKEVQAAGENSRRCNLSCDTEELGVINISLWNKFSDLSKTLWRYATLHLFNIQQVPDTEKLYTTTKDSFIVLEPDFLINATDIAGCFNRGDANPRIHLLKKFIEFRNTEPLLLGKIVNSCFDELLTNPRTPFKKIFDKEIQRDQLALAANPSLKVNSLRQNAQRHYNALQRAVKYLEIDSALIEPTHLSSRYGLQGRLDVVLQYADDDNRRNIVELKSGSAPALHIGIWKNHLMQVTCYNLLLDSCFPNRRGGANILYSGAEDEPLRNAPNITPLKQDALMLRNQIVALEHRLMKDAGGLIQEINPDTFGTAPVFLEDEVMDFKSTLSAASSLEKKYVGAFMSFIAREQWVAKMGSGVDDGNEGFAALWRSSLNEKTSSFNILTHLRLKKDDSDFRNLNLVLERTGKTLKTSNFRAGDIAVLYPLEPDGELRPLQHQILRCVIKEIDDRYIKVSLRNKQQTQTYFNRFSYWALEHDLIEAAFNRMHQSLFNFLKASPKKKKMLLGLEKPRFKSIPLIKAQGLNKEQRRHLSKAMSARDYFLLQGPPGTGKTSMMLREMVRHLLNNTEEDVVLLALTNRSVDEICDAVKDIGDEVAFIRLGNKKTTEHPGNLLSTLIQDKSIQEIRELIKETRIFVSTVSSFLSHQELLHLKRFSTAIVDEASQLLEPHLVGLLSRVDCFILIGDEKQLPAIVTQRRGETIVEDEDLKSAGFRDLRTSFFERLLKCSQRKGWSEASGMLSGQGRMHREVAEYPNQVFYSNKLKPIYDWQENTEQRFSPDSSDPIERMLAKSRILFIPTRREQQTKVHTQEACYVSWILQSIARVYGRDFNNETVGVITPYRAQIAEISGKLPENLRGLVTIDTVERFQGSEREIILLSFAVNHPQQLRNLQALTLDGGVDRKLNVALTRAKKHMILLGCPDVLIHKTHFKQLIEFIKTRGGYVSEGIKPTTTEKALQETS